MPAEEKPFAQPSTPKGAKVALARLAVVTGANDKTGESIPVHFNPASLQLQLSNELKDTKNNERKQYIAKTSAKLTMDLLFDTTHTGADVTGTTRKLQAFISPPLPPGQEARPETPPPLVLFEWGTLRFKGIAESYKETIDFFSAGGVPLRASVNLTLSRQDKVFDESPGGARGGGAKQPDNSKLDTAAPSAADAAKNLEEPGAARALAAANGEENLRFSAGASLSVGAQVELKPPVAFAAGGAGLSLGAGAGLDLGIGGGAAAGIGTAAGASAGVSFTSASGATAGIAGMARLSATEGAFAGLRVSTSGPSSVRLNPAKLVPKPSSASTSIAAAGAGFQIGRRATASGSGRLRADVGATSKLSFDGG